MPENYKLRFNGRFYSGKNTNGRSLKKGDVLTIQDPFLTASLVSETTRGTWVPANDAAIQLCEEEGIDLTPKAQPESEDESVEVVAKEKPKCAYIKKDDTQCQILAQEGKEYCAIHEKMKQKQTQTSETVEEEDSESEELEVL